MYSSFELSSQVGGEFDGVEYLRLKAFGAATNGDKTKKLSLGNPYQRDASGFFKIYANSSDPFCLVKLFKYYVVEHLLPAMKEEGLNDSFFFVRRAPKKVLKVRIKKGLRTEAGMAGQHSKWGPNYFPDMMKALAKRCGFDDADNYTMRSNRRAGITKLAGSNIGSANVMAAARHKSVDANVLYQQENEADHVARSKVFHSSFGSKTSTVSTNATTQSSLSTSIQPEASMGNHQQHNSLATNQQNMQSFQQSNSFPFMAQQQPFQPFNPMMMGMMSGMMMGMMGMMGGLQNPMMMGMGMMGNQNQQQTMPSYPHQQQWNSLQQPVVPHNQPIARPQSNNVLPPQQETIRFQPQQEEIVHLPTQVTPQQTSTYRCQLLDSYEGFDHGVDPPENSDDDSLDHDDESNSEVDNENQPYQFTQTQSYRQQASNLSTPPSNGASL